MAGRCRPLSPIVAAKSVHGADSQSAASRLFGTLGFHLLLCARRISARPDAGFHASRRPMPVRMRTWLLIPVWLFTLAEAQAPLRLHARLSPVAMDAAMRATVAGSGSVSAELTGSRLIISGSFEGLRSAATMAQLRRGPVTGVRGPAVFDLTVTKALTGAIEGSFDLTPEQVESLRKGIFYIQLHSEKAPDGNLWGWLLP